MLANIGACLQFLTLIWSLLAAIERGLAAAAEEGVGRRAALRCQHRTLGHSPDSGLAIIARILVIIAHFSQSVESPRKLSSHTAFHFPSDVAGQDYSFTPSL
jgi:hypothetical protein